MQYTPWKLACRMTMAKRVNIDVDIEKFKIYVKIENMNSCHLNAQKSWDIKCSVQ